MTPTEFTDTMKAFREFCIIHKIYYLLDKDMLSMVYKKNLIKISLNSVEDMYLQNEMFTIRYENNMFFNFCTTTETVSVRVFS